MEGLPIEAAKTKGPVQCRGLASYLECYLPVRAKFIVDTEARLVVMTMAHMSMMRSVVRMVRIFRVVALIDA
jgi:alkyl hydroperoxide reductase subunit AhpC